MIDKMALQFDLQPTLPQSLLHVIKWLLPHDETQKGRREFHEHTCPFSIILIRKSGQRARPQGGQYQHHVGTC